MVTISTLLAVACDSPALSNTNRSNSAGAKTNVNAVNSVPYSRTENAYTFAQNSDLARDLTPSGKEAREIVGKTLTEGKLAPELQGRTDQDEVAQVAARYVYLSDRIGGQNVDELKTGDFASDGKEGGVAELLSKRTRTEVPAR